jgi:ATP-binding cassette subfamily C (CFTR/MRP) protein 1
MQPFFIRRVINFVGEPITNESTNHGWGLTAAYGLVYVGIAVSIWKCLNSNIFPTC